MQCVYPLCVMIQEIAYSSCLSVVRNRDLVGLLTVAHDCLCLQAWNFVCVGVGHKRGAPPMVHWLGNYIGHPLSGGVKVPLFKFMYSERV